MDVSLLEHGESSGDYSNMDTNAGTTFVDKAKKHGSDIIAGAAAATSIVGLFIYAAYVHTPGPLYRFNSYLGIWMTCLTLFLSAQCFYLTRTTITKKLFNVGIVYFGVAFLLNLVLVILFGISDNSTGLGWCLFMMAITAFNLIVLMRKHGAGQKTQSKEYLNEFKGPATKLKALIVIDYVLGVLALIFLGLLIGGGYNSAYGVMNYPPRGKFMTVTLSDGRPQTIHYICKGPTNSGHKTFWFEVGGGHVAADFYGIQQLLTERNVRSCIYDRPGMGWSSLAHTTDPFWYKEMLHASGEKGPFIMCGWAAGGLIMINATIQYPEEVAALVLMDASSVTEAEAYAYSHQVSPEEAEKWYLNEIASRNGMFDIIRGIGTPVGLMKSLLPYKPEDYFPPELYDEFFWFSLQENYWTTQYFALQELVNNRHSYDESKLPRHVPIGILLSRTNVTQLCIDNHYALDSKDCLYLRREDEFFTNSRLAYASKTDNATVIWCEDCDLGFPVRKPHFVVNALIEMFGI